VDARAGGHRQEEHEPRRGADGRARRPRSRRNGCARSSR
jgi:hypothetical protein